MRKHLSLLFLCLLTLPARGDFSRAWLDTQPLQVAPANGIEIAYRSIGTGDQPTVVMIMGLGAKLARGCTSGQALTGGAMLSVGSWLFIIGAFAAGYVAAPLFRRQWT